MKALRKMLTTGQNGMSESAFRVARACVTTFHRLLLSAASRIDGAVRRVAQQTMACSALLNLKTWPTCRYCYLPNMFKSPEDGFVANS